ncbi:hypothetical protein TNCV_4506731 [Trichonephila clavipes]|nr:hypothetical protein TNCV_4506731 [Trichonephila clavipes]
MLTLDEQHCVEHIGWEQCAILGFDQIGRHSTQNLSDPKAIYELFAMDGYQGRRSQICRIVSLRCRRCSWQTRPEPYVSFIARWSPPQNIDPFLERRARKQGDRLWTPRWNPHLGQKLRRTDLSTPTRRLGSLWKVDESECVVVMDTCWFRYPLVAQWEARVMAALVEM